MAEDTPLTLRRAGETAPHALPAQPPDPCHGTAPNTQDLASIPSVRPRENSLSLSLGSVSQEPQQEAALTELAVQFHVQLDDAVRDGGGSRDLQHHVGVLGDSPILRS